MEAWLSHPGFQSAAAPLAIALVVAAAGSRLLLSGLAIAAGAAVFFAVVFVAGGALRDVFERPEIDEAEDDEPDLASGSDGGVGDLLGPGEDL